MTGISVQRMLRWLKRVLEHARAHAGSVLFLPDRVPRGAFGDMLEYVTPRGGSIGSTVEAVLHGANLQDPKEVRFDDDCIRATNVVPVPKSEKEIKARFVIGPACKLGEHVLRLRTATNLSEPVTFWVSPFPAVREIEKKQGENDTPQKAQIVPLNSTVEGEIQGGQDADVDVYRVDVRAGDRLSVEVEGMRLGTATQGGLNDLMLRILNSDGKELAVSKDTALFVEDPVASIVTPADKGRISSRSSSRSTRLRGWRFIVRTSGRSRVRWRCSRRAASGARVSMYACSAIPRASESRAVKLPDQLGDFQYFAGKFGRDAAVPQQAPGVAVSERNLRRGKRSDTRARAAGGVEWNPRQKQFGAIPF